MAKFDLKMKVFIPASRVTLYDTSATKIQYGGDGRNQSWNGKYRTMQLLTIDTAPTNYTVSHSKDTGTTYEYTIDKATGKETVRYDKAATTGITYAKRVSDGFLYIDIEVDCGNPLQPDAPNINYQFTIKVTRSGIIRLTGKHDGFPAYELWRQDYGETPRLLWTHDHRDTGETSISLGPPMEHSVDVNLGS